MASESTEERTVTVSLPAELDRWLDEQARELDADREALLVQLVASYRAAADLGDGEASVTVADSETVSEAVESQLGETVDDRIEAGVQSAVESVVADRISEATNAVQQQVGERIDTLEADYEADLEDVRERVVQLKREIDGKAADDHEHAAFDRIDDLEARLSDLEERLGAIQDDREADIAELRESVDEVETDLEAVQERLQTVAWVVSDLREAHENTTGLDAVDRIKRAAAKMDVDRAVCESCGDGVEIALMTDPECPHCQATVTDVQAANGFFGKPRLLVASQLESGDER